MYCPNRECVDFEETGEPGEYRDDVEVCPKCGARLVHERPELDERDAAPPEEDDAIAPEGPLVAVAEFNFRQDADLAASVLWASGVPAVVFAGTSGTDPRIEFGSRVRLMVSERDVEAARALLEQEAPASAEDA